MSDAESISSDSDESVSPPISERAASLKTAAEGQLPSDHEKSKEETSTHDEKAPRSLSRHEPQPTEDKVQLRVSHGVHLAWSGHPHRAEEPTNGSDGNEVAFDFVVVPGIEGEWETASPWISKSYEVGKNRILRFEYPTQGFYSGSKCRDSIRNTALQLLRGVSALREGDSVKRLIVFVAHGLGGIIVKDSLVAAALDPEAFADISNMSRVLVFVGCPHRSRGQRDMEDKLSRYFFASSTRYQFPDYTPTIPSVTALATAIIQVNGMFVDSKHLLRSRAISIYAGPESGTSLSPVFDDYCGTIGFPFETRILNTGRDDEYPQLVDKLRNLETVFNVVFDEGVFLRERKILSLASPIDPFRTVLAVDAPVTSTYEYKTWLKLRGPQVLYVHGSDAVSDASEQIFFALEKLPVSQTTVVFYFSFDQWDVRRDSVRDMASTFLAQIICQFPCNKEWAEAFFQHLSYERGWTEADLLNWFERFRLNNEFEEAIFVINHFDQCTNGSRRLFLDRLRFLASHSENPYKIVLTSQKTGVLLDDLSGTPLTVLDLLASTESPEGGTGRTNFVDETEKRLMQLRPELLIHASLVREQLESIVDIDPLARQILCEQAGVWSLWPETISFREMVSGGQGLDLAEGQWDESLLACLLDQILSKISNDSESQQEKLRSQLSWILCAVRPLTVWELGNALLLSRKETAIKDSRPSPAMLENLVSGTLNELAGIVHVVHNEVRIVHPRIRSVFLVAGKKPAGSSLSFFGGKDVHDKGHSDIALLSLKYSSTPSGRKRIDQIYNLSKALGVPVFTDRGDLCAYSLQAWTHHFLLVSPDSSQRKDLEQQLRIGGLPGLSHLDLARGHWALSNPITRSHTSLESLFPIFAGFGVLDDTLIETSETTKVLRAALLEASSKRQSKAVKQLLDRDKFTEETLLEALVLAGASGDEQLALDLVRYISNSSSSPSTIAWPPSLLFRSCSLGLSRLAEKLLQLGISADPDVPWRKIIKASPLSQAVRFNHVATTEVLLKHGADTKLFHPGKNTHLHIAASLGNVGILKPLCELGKAELDAKADSNLTPVYLAALRGQHAAVEELLKLGADPNMGFTSESPVSQWSPIIVAAEGGHQLCIKSLLQHKANPDAWGPAEHGTALGYAAVNGHLEVCRLLLEAGADPNSSLIIPPLIWKVAESLSGQDKQEMQLNILKLLIEYGTNVNARTSDGVPVLSAIVRHLENAEAVCELLLDKGADVNLVDPDGESPLYHAACASKKNPAVIKLLLDRGADVNNLSNKGASALYFAIPSAESVRLLMGRGANPSLGRREANDFTPLMYAAWFEDHLESLKVLLEYKPDLEARFEVPNSSITGATAIACAVIAGPAAAVKLLAEAGADLQNTGIPILRSAAFEDKQDKLDVLLEFLPRLNLKETDDDGWTAIHWNIPHAHFNRLLNIGIDPNIQDNNGATPLYHHVIHKNVAHIKSLLRSGANPNLLTHWDGGPLHHAASDLRLDIAQLLVKHGADPNAASPVTGNTLNSACSQSSSETSDDSVLTEMVKYLLDKGADPNTTSGLTGYAINMAVSKGSLSIVDILLKKGSARVDLKDEVGRTTLHWAASGGNVAVFRKILDAGCDAKARDVTGRTLLQYAAQTGRAEMVEHILGQFYQDGGEDIDTTDKDGWTALCWAARGPHSWSQSGREVTSEVMDDLAKVIKMLVDHGARKDVEVTFHNEKWTPVRIARYHSAPLEIVELLETNNDSSTEVPVQRAAAVREGVICDVCLVRFCGLRYRCRSCGWYDLCFKCYPYRALVHKPGNHDFVELGPEYEEKKNESLEEGGDDGSGDGGAGSEASSTTTDSDTESDDEE